MSGPALTKSSKDKNTTQAKGPSQEQPRQPGLDGPQANLLALQDTAGNKAVSRSLPPDRGLSSLDNDSQGKTDRDSSLKPLPSANASTLDTKGLPSSVRSLLNRGSGQPLDPATRAFMESRLGYDFGSVRVHTGGQAARSAQAVNATAYTVGRDIVFGEGSYAPSSTVGRELLAHELAHTIQQGMATKIVDADQGINAEQAARAAAERVMLGVPHVPIGQIPSVPSIQAEGSPQTSPLKLPSEGIDMPWVSKAGGASASEKGYLRDREYFWTEFYERFGRRGMLSNRNKQRILGRPFKSPKVDSTWVRYYPQHRAYRGETLEHHHMGQGSRAVPLPKSLHQAKSVLHPTRQTVGKPRRPLKPLKPQPTPERTEREIARHTRRGKLRGRAIDPTNPPRVPPIPPSSELAGLPPEELRPVSQKELAELRRVDPATGRVIRTEEPTVSQPRPATPAPEPAAPRHRGRYRLRLPSLRFRGPMKIKGFRTRGGARGLVGAVLMLILGHYINKKIEEWEEKMISKDMERLDPKIQKRLDILKPDIDMYLYEAPGAQLYAHITVTIVYSSVSMPEEPYPITTYARTDLTDVGWSAYELAKPKKGIPRSSRQLSHEWLYYPVTFSMPLETVPERRIPRRVGPERRIPRRVGPERRIPRRTGGSESE